MKRISRYCIAVSIALVLLSSMVFGASPVVMNKAYSMLGKGDSCYILGGFKLIHTMDSTVGDPDIISTGQNLNSLVNFHTRIDLVNTDTNKIYSFDVNPVTGSDNTWYYRNAKKLETNDQEPYWVISVPAGNYEVANFSCMMSKVEPGYNIFTWKWIDVPVAKLVGREIKFSVQNKQLMYIGDYNCSIASYIVRNKQTEIYAPRKMGIDLQNNFDSVKETLINGADNKTKEKLNNLEMISAF